MTDITYEEYRTGLTFKEVRQMLSLEAKRKYDKGEYMFVTRHTVLGRWRELKQMMYKDYQRQFASVESDIVINSDFLI